MEHLLWPHVVTSGGSHPDVLTHLTQVQACMDACGWLPVLTARLGQGYSP